MAAAMKPTCAPDQGADCLFCDPLCTAYSPPGHLQPWLQIVILPQAISALSKQEQLLTKQRQRLGESGPTLCACLPVKVLLLSGRQWGHLCMTSGVTFHDPAMPVAIAVAVPNDARLHKGAVACHRYGAHVVVAQVKMPLHDAQPLMSCTNGKGTCSPTPTARCEKMLPLVAALTAQTCGPSTHNGTSPLKSHRAASDSPRTTALCWGAAPQAA